MPDYGTVAGFRAYHLGRGRDADAGVYTNDEVEKTKLIASEWIDGMFRSLFPGWRVAERSVQIREWPRYGVVDIDGYAVDDATVPVEVENATYEATLKELLTPGSLLQDYTPSKYRKVSISGAVSVEYDKIQAADVQTQFPIIAQILAPILDRSAERSWLSGAASRV